MKIGIDIRSTLKRRRRTGIGYYTLNLIKHLAIVDPESEYFLYSYIRLFDFKRSLPPLPAPNFRHRLDRLNFRPDIKMKDMDVFHSSSYDIPTLNSAKFVTTVHDIIPLVHSEGFREEYLKKLDQDIRKVLDESDLIVVDSNSTKNDLEKMFSPVSKRIEVVYPGRDESFSPIDKESELIGDFKRRHGIDREFILFVGTVEKRKNVMNLVRAYNELKKEKNLPHALVIVGMKGWEGGKAYELVEELGLKDEVKFTSYIDRRDMNLFYSAADLFVYPSLYEGFGLPILEAFSCGTPTVTSSTTSCGEIAGDAALTTDPRDTVALKEAMGKVLRDKDLREELGRKGLDRARLFSWDNAAEQFRKIFYELVERNAYK
ncbi:MAG: glycosyltransferase family 4 protein [Candidatus Omnitrophota bacterium]